MELGVSVRTPAKINLTLDIIGKRADGYHFIRSIMQAVSLYDEIKITYDGTSDAEDIIIKCNVESIPCDRRNLVYKATKAFFDYFNESIPCGITIDIEKSIPQLAGLAGGSSDAAATFVALNELFDKKLSLDELSEIAVDVGADIPFCIHGGTMLAEGVGDILSPLPNLPECFFVIAKPDNVDISTPEAFAKFDSFDAPLTSQFDDFIASLTVSNLDDVSGLLFNALEIAADCDEIKVLKDKMSENGALGVLMSGSGSAVYGIFDKKRTAQKCADELQQDYSFVTVCTPCEAGAVIIESDT